VLRIIQVSNYFSLSYDYLSDVHCGHVTFVHRQLLEMIA